MRLSRDKVQVCKVQGRLFELSAREGVGSREFVDAFMSSSVAERLDDTFDRLQWAGEEYILEELADEVGGAAGPGASTQWAAGSEAV